MEGLEQLPMPPFITYETDEDGGKIANMDVTLSSGEQITLKFTSRFEGKKQLLEKALSAKNYEALYDSIAEITDDTFDELTEEEVSDLTQNNPEGYTLDDYRRLNPDSGLITEGNPIGVEYTLTFGTGMGKYITHGGSDYDIYLQQLVRLQHDGEGASDEAENLKQEMRKRLHMTKDYQHLANYAHPSVFKERPELYEKIVAEIRSFRVLHPWVYKDISDAHEREKGPKKTFRINP